MSRCKIVWMIPLAGLLALPACHREQTEAPDTAAETTAAPEAPAAPAPAAPAAGPTATATLKGAPNDTDFTGTVTFTQEGDGVRVVADFAGVDKPGKHGFHVHMNGECAHDPTGAKHFDSAGGHFNPTNTEHACPPTEPRHAGDLGNVEIGANGQGHAEMTSNLLSLSGPNSVVGKAILLHEGEDDCKTQPSGNSGARIACGVVTMEGGTSGQ